MRLDPRDVLDGRGPLPRRAQPDGAALPAQLQSSLARAVAQAVAAAPACDERKVRALRQALARGAYRPDAEGTAAGLLALEAALYGRRR